MKKILSRKNATHRTKKLFFVRGSFGGEIENDC